MRHVTLQTSIVAEALADLLLRVREAVPILLAGVLFLVLAALVVRAVQSLLSFVLGRVLPGTTSVYRQFVVTVVGVFLWFAVALSFLSVVGLDGIATSLGTAAGFVALGIAYAVSDMIADAVSGVYLLEDPDFEPGDTISVDDTTGVVRTIELRKTRIEVEGDVVVLGNADIEGQWRKHRDG